MKKLILVLLATLFVCTFQPAKASSLNTKNSLSINKFQKDDVYLGLVWLGDTGICVGYYIQDFTTKNITFYYDDGTVESYNYGDE